MRYSYDYYTDIGGRENNEDSLCAECEQEAYLFAVADGLGGHECGEIASGIAIGELKRQFKENPNELSLTKAFEDANKIILQKQAEMHNSMKTTLVAAYIFDKKIVLANVGDSRGYLLLENSIVFQTLDHSASQTAVSVGEITADQIRHHEDRNILTRALGVADELKVDITELEEKDFDKLLLCSDGFWEYVLENEICDNTGNAVGPHNWLMGMKRIHKKRIPSNNDNNTAITVVRGD